MKTIILMLALVACGGSDPTPDASEFNPTGGWKLSLAIAADSCAHAATTETQPITVTCNSGVPATNCQITAFSNSVVGQMMSCGASGCSASFSLDWTVGSSNYVESYTSAIFSPTTVVGSGSRSFNQGTQSCNASFSFIGALQ